MCDSEYSVQLDGRAGYVKSQVVHSRYKPSRYSFVQLLPCQMSASKTMLRVWLILKKVVNSVHISLNLGKKK